MESALVEALKREIGAAQVGFDSMTRLLYSTDASNYQILPVGVTFPRHSDDVIAIHELASHYQIPVLPRGGGTGLAGQTVGHAIVMDFSRHMRRIRSINAETNTVTVEPGLVLEHLNRQVNSFNLMYGPDPASADRATLGGCIGNNSTGSHSILYGMTSDHIRRLEVVFANGERTWLDANSEFLNQLRSKIGTIVYQNKAEIENCFPKTWRSVAGYAFNRLNPHNIDLKWLMAGSEGTLATVVQAELDLVPIPKMKQLALVHFDSLRESLEIVPALLETNPAAVELIDRPLLDLTRQHIEYRSLLTFVEGDPAALLIVEYYGDSESQLEAHLQNLRRSLKNAAHTGVVTYAVTAKEQYNVWAVRKAGLGLLSSARGDAKPLSFIEDAAVPVEYLADYIDEVVAAIYEAGTTFGIYAHASAGCLHISPLIDLKSAEGQRQYRAIAEGVIKILKKYNGTSSGEHGEGLVRSEFSEQIFGTALVKAFEKVKQAFDPHNLMNPGKIVNSGRMDDSETMRYSPTYEIIPVKTRYDWSADFGLSGAVEMCNGAGVCRKEGVGTMCPSYMATLDEAHATRGRANALRHAMSGHLPDGVASKAVHEVYDLCLSCKACKAECPSAVDVAQIKAEFLALYHDAHGIPLKSRVFANIHRLNALGSLFPRLSNLMLNMPLTKWAFRQLDIPTERPLPRLAAKRFSHQVQGHLTAPATLIVDTFTEFNHPEVGLALMQIAEKRGLQLRVMRLPNQGCCGRPAISKGLLDLAKNMAHDNLSQLKDMEGTFLFLEPSCLSAFVDDYLKLVAPDLQQAAADVASRCLTVEQWLVQHMNNENIQWDNHPRRILLHGHCHQKALWGTAETRQLLKTIPQAEVTEIDSGCCGVAGSFGYEHYDISLKIANQRLLPAIAANPEALVVAPGTSCRTQIHEAGYRVWHPVEIVAQALR